MGTFAARRAWLLPYASAALGGVVFAFGNFLPAQVHHENIVRTVSWLPVMLALSERALRVDCWRAQMRGTLLAAMPPFLGGGEMIETVSMESSTYAGLPHKYEAGTPPIAEAVALGAAVDYPTNIGREPAAAHAPQTTTSAHADPPEVPAPRGPGPAEPQSYPRDR